MFFGGFQGRYFQSFVIAMVDLVFGKPAADPRPTRSEPSGHLRKVPTNTYGVSIIRVVSFGFPNLRFFGVLLVFCVCFPARFCE